MNNTHNRIAEMLEDRAALAQPKKEWVELTEEESRKLCRESVPYVADMVTALQASLKEKNT